MSHWSEWPASTNKQTTSASKDVEEGELLVELALLVEMQTGAATVESSMEIAQKIKNGTAL